MNKDATRIKMIPEVEFTGDLDAQIKKLLCKCFPKDIPVFSQTRYWNNVRPACSFIVEINHEMIAHCAMIDRNVTVGDTIFRAAGIGNVCVDPEHQGQGLSRILLSESMHYAQNLNYDFGLLFCKEKIQDCYVKSGWRPVHVPDILRLTDDGKEDSWLKNNVDELMMYYPLQQEIFPDGIVNLNGINW